MKDYPIWGFDYYGYSYISEGPYPCVPSLNRTIGFRIRLTRRSAMDSSYWDAECEDGTHLSVSEEKLREMFVAGKLTKGE